MNENYLLTTPMGQRLYKEIASSLPLIDYHNHLSIGDLAMNRQFNDISEIWLLGDPYKHRAMRICGVEEKYITGEAPNKEKFNMWCAVYPKLLGGPLYDWSRMEMEKVFGISLEICPENADRIWAEANEKLSGKGFGALDLLRNFNVKYAAPCTALTDDMTPFLELDGIAPSLRGDDLLLPGKTLAEKLTLQTGIGVTDASSLRRAICSRLDELGKAGCRFSDHALDNGFRYVPESGDVESLISASLLGADLSPEEKAAVSSAMLRMLGEEYACRHWTMQLHIGAQRFTSTRLRSAVGGAGGFAGIGKCVDVNSLTGLLDDMEQGMHSLPKVIMYTLNPADNAVISVLSGSFIGVTQGPAWWWCDHLQGMREMLDTFSTFSVLSTFVGMTTDSRSLLSLLRHDYFRRMFCGWVGEKAQRGELPNSFEILSELTRDVCFENANELI